MLFPVVRKLNAQLALVVVAVVILCCVSMVAHAAVDDDDLAGFPERPSMFRSPEELKEYLRALNEYFAIAGRPRKLKYSMQDRPQEFEKKTDFLQLDTVAADELLEFRTFGRSVDRFSANRMKSSKLHGE